MAIIIRGYNGDASPNLNKIVTVGVVVAEHPEFGKTVQIMGEGLIIENNPSRNFCNIPVKWLKKINGPKLPPKEKTIKPPVKELV